MNFNDQVLKVAPNAHLVYKRAFTGAGDTLARYGITTPLRVAHFMAQILHESGRLRILTESLNYSVQALISKYVPRRMSRELAEQLGRAGDQKANQVTIANTIYGGTFGRVQLGNTEPADGWTYRGHGLIQLTGRGNFRRIGLSVGIDLEANPALTLDPRYAFEVPCVFWADGDCNEAADRDDVVAVTKGINGGTNGLAERRELLELTKAVWR
jgi:putative chitinase